MSFLTGFALLIGLLVAAPVVAHLLRRGKVREQPFVPVGLIPQARTSARQKSRLDDKVLLSLRALLILALALLGAAPLIRCSRVSLSRQSGASVALALVVDDSLSMRALTASGKPRFSEAVTGAEQLMSESREGDVVAIVLAGSPARVLLPPTTNLKLVRETLSQLTPSDRSTDLETAVELARASVKSLSHRDKRVLVFSDFAATPPKEGEPQISVPLPALQAKVDNCAVVSAEKSDLFLNLQLACTSAKAALGRQAIAVAAKSQTSALNEGEELGRVPLPGKAGESSLSIKLLRSAAYVNVYLDGSDALSHDDSAPSSGETGALRVGVVGDRTLGSVVTGGPPILEQVLGALEAKLVVHPLSNVPENDKELDAEDLLILDDPIAFTPEMRAALNAWLGRGKVAVGLFGPRVGNAQLGSNFEPFFRGGATWQKPATSSGLLAASLAWLGESSTSFAELAPQGEIIFPLEPTTEILGRWTSNNAFLLETRVGRGSALSVGLPASVDESDLALRPGFVALLDYFVDLALDKSGPHVSEVGHPWRLPADANPTVVGPSGALASRFSSADDQRTLVFDPPLVGRYQVTSDKKGEERVATITAEEVLNEPVPFAAKKNQREATQSEPLLEISPQIALAALVLFTLELAFLWVRRFRLSARNAGATS
ncbi:MAG: VWA domain-containing protein [Polyangiaceae bacterium]|nr:VWA domain-containing protein [Polyangiaceae bacterium]